MHVLSTAWKPACALAVTLVIHLASPLPIQPESEGTPQFPTITGSDDVFTDPAGKVDFSRTVGVRHSKGEIRMKALSQPSRRYSKQKYRVLPLADSITMPITRSCTCIFSNIS